MADPQKDKRVYKTKRNIHLAFIRLLNKKDYNKISVKDVADEANCDRKTVYYYYAGVYEIRDEIENEFIELVDESVKLLDFQKYGGNPKRIFEILTDIINENIETYGSFLKWDAQSHIIRKITMLFTDKVCQGLERSKYSHVESQKLRTVACFITSGMVACYQEWFNTGRKQSIEALSSNLGELVLNGIKALEA